MRGCGSGPARIADAGACSRLIPSLGALGKGGNSVRSVREESGCFVSIVKADFRHVQERIMVLKGSVEQIAAATKGITTLHFQDPTCFGSVAFVLRVHLPASLVDHATSSSRRRAVHVRTGGAKFQRQPSERTKARITLSHHPVCRSLLSFVV
jgi:hypothetical protein